MSDTQLAKKTEALPDAVQRRGITESLWRMLFNLYPGAKPDSALMVWDYCKARGLDPMKKPCHIVPMDYKDDGGNWKKRDIVMPGIYEYRITAHRTQTYLGHSKPVYGETIKYAGVDAPEWCEMTFYRWHPGAQRVIEFPVQVFFSEVVATNRDGGANARWTRAPRQMLTKCTEAAGLREGWPEEFGGEATAEELEGHPSIAPDAPVVMLEDRPQPGQRRSAAVIQPITPAAREEVIAGGLEPEPELEESAPQYIGTIATLTESAAGALVQLSTGYVAATKNPEMIAALKRWKESGEALELSTIASSDPSKWAPWIEEILPVRESQA